jgi:hypothetical protein
MVNRICFAAAMSKYSHTGGRRQMNFQLPRRAAFGLTGDLIPGAQFQRSFMVGHHRIGGGGGLNPHAMIRGRPDDVERAILQHAGKFASQVL